MSSFLANKYMVLLNGSFVKPSKKNLYNSLVIYSHLQLNLDLQHSLEDNKMLLILVLCIFSKECIKSYQHGE